MEWSKKLPLASGSELLDSLAVMASGLARATICVGKAILLMVIGAAAAVALVASTSASTLAALILALIFGAWALVSCAAAFTLFALTWDRLGGGSTVCFIFVVVGMTVLIAATAKAVLMRVGAPFVGFAAMAVLQENVEFSAAHFGWLATSGLVFGGYILGTAALVYRPRRSIVTHSKITSECIRIVLYGYTLTWLDDTARVFLAPAARMEESASDDDSSSDDDDDVQMAPAPAPAPAPPRAPRKRARAPPGRAEASKLSPKKRLLRKKQAQMRSRRGGD